MRKVSNEVSKSRRALATGLAMGAIATGASMEIADMSAEHAAETNKIVLDIVGGELHPIEAVIQFMNEQGYNAWRSEAIDNAVENGVDPDAIVRLSPDQSSEYAEMINQVYRNLTGRSVYESDMYDIQQGEKVLVGYYKEGDRSE